MKDKIISAIEKWEKNGLNIYHWFNHEEVVRIAELIEMELRDAGLLH